MLAGQFGVLVGPLVGQPTYDVSLIGVDGKMVAKAGATTPNPVSCANGAGALVPLPVSTSDTRAYFMDSDGIVRFLAPNGDTGRATTVPVGSGRRSMFAVSPDDQQIAVVVADFSSSGASTRLYVEDLNGGGHHVNTFSESGPFTLWPTGWHGTNNLVVAKVPACTQGGGPGCCGPQEFHVVDPATAVRRFTIGGTCWIAGPPSPAGSVCETQARANVISWTGTTVRSFSIQGLTPAYLSPDGMVTAIVGASGTTFDNGGTRTLAMQACGWIDSTHVISAGDVQQPRIGSVDGNLVPVNSLGTCGGRIPGGL